MNYRTNLNQVEKVINPKVDINDLDMRELEKEVLAYGAKRRDESKKIKTYLQFSDDYFWDSRYNAVSIMGYYTVNISRKLMEEKVGQNVTTMKNVLAALLTETLLEFSVDDKEVSVKCFWNEGPCIDNLEGIEIVKNAMEKDIRKQLEQIGIDEYTLILDISNCY